VTLSLTNSACAVPAVSGTGESEVEDDWVTKVVAGGKGGGRLGWEECAAAAAAALLLSVGVPTWGNSASRTSASVVFAESTSTTGTEAGCAAKGLPCVCVCMFVCAHACVYVCL
jgi:hypothetical protein